MIPRFRGPRVNSFIQIRQFLIQTKNCFERCNCFNISMLNHNLNCYPQSSYCLYNFFGKESNIVT